MVPLDLEQVRSGVTHLVEEEGIEALAVSFLWSFANRSHEERAVAAALALYPDLPVVSGAELHPAIREYERTTFAVLNAYVSGAFAGIEELEAELQQRGLKTPLLLVHSGGGSITVGEARRRPLGLAMSGPAAGVAAAVALSQATVAPHLITADMGGTSFDVSIIDDGAPARRTRGEMMGVWTALSLVDVESIGAGGGSLGWVDARGMLRVGPRSAGATPGPACYQRGGTQATVTDALVVLGYIDPTRFLGGDFALDAGAAFAACERLGAQFDLEPEETAWGIRQLALTGMIKAVRGRLASLGLDPRLYAILSYGGGGSLFTPEIARAIGTPRVLIPELASVLSAFGAATTDVRRERLRSVALPHARRSRRDATPHGGTGRRGQGGHVGRRRGRRATSTSSSRPTCASASRSTNCRCPWPPRPSRPPPPTQLLASFMDEYAKRYGKGSIVLRTPVELVGLRGHRHRPHHPGQHRRLRRSRAVESGTPAVPVGTRQVRIDRGTGRRVEVDVYDGAGLAPGHELKGAGPGRLDGHDDLGARRCRGAASTATARSRWSIT